MAERITGTIVSSTTKLAKGLAEDIQSVINVEQVITDYSFAFEAIKKNLPEAIFLELYDKDDAGLNLAERLRRKLPDTPVFFVSDNKHTDLILEGLRLGIADYLVYPDENVLPVVKKALGKIETGRNTGELVTMFSLKGGQGVTSLSINLADKIRALTGEKILLLDYNLYLGDISSNLNISCGYTPFDLLTDIDRMDSSLLFSSLTEHPNGFHILTVQEEIKDADQITGKDTATILRFLKKHFDYIVVDLPHDFSEKTIAAFDEADTILIIAQQSIPVIKSVKRIRELFDELGYSKKKVKIILNRYLKNIEVGPEDLAEIFNQPVYSIITNDYSTIARSVNKGLTIGSAFEQSKINSDIEALAGKLTHVNTEKKKSGWLSLVTEWFPWK